MTARVELIRKGNGATVTRFQAAKAEHYKGSCQVIQESGVEILLHDVMFFTEVHEVDLVAVHKFDCRELCAEAVHSGRYGEDLGSGLGKQKVC